MSRHIAYLRAGLLVLAAAVLPCGGLAAETLRLSAPAQLIDTGLLKYVLPRFSLKTGVQIDLVPPGAPAEIILAPDADGPGVFSGSGATWRMQVTDAGHEGAARFADWLQSEIGQRTVTSFEIDGVAPFSPPAEQARRIARLVFDGDPVQGRALSVLHCGRCHAVSEETRMNTIGSTPSFFALRAMRDWTERFQAFYALNPHPSFTQVDEVTAPFPIERPSPIAPVEITLGDLEDIMAYVSDIPPADLGAPVQHQ